MKPALLRNLLLLDAAVLILLGLIFILAPGKTLQAFHFQNLPAAVNYMIALWGCVFLTLGFGYFIAASDPYRNIVWVQVGMARGALECIVGIVYVSTGTISWGQAAFGLAAAAFITIAYIILYPRIPKPVATSA
jgi:hypothetical protein